MATNSNELANTEYETRILVCGICKNRKQEPKFLSCQGPCRDSFCKKCLQEKLDESQDKIIVCPGCNENVKLLAGIDELKDDAFAENLSQAKDKECVGVRCTIHRDKLVNYICFTCQTPVCEDCIELYSNGTNAHFEHIVRDFKTAFKSIKCQGQRKAEYAKQLLSQCNNCVTNFTTDYKQMTERKIKELCNYINEHVKQTEEVIQLEFLSTINELVEQKDNLEKLLTCLKNIDASFNDRENRMANNVSNSTSALYSRTIADTANVLKEMEDYVQKLQNCERTIEMKMKGVSLNHRSLDSQAENENNNFSKLIRHYVGFLERGIRVYSFPRLKHVDVVMLPPLTNVRIRGLHFENEDGYTVYDGQSNTLHTFNKSLVKISSKRPDVTDEFKHSNTFYHRVANSEFEYDCRQKSSIDLFVTTNKNKRHIFVQTPQNIAKCIDTKLTAVADARKWVLLPLCARWSEDWSTSAYVANINQLDKKSKASVKCAHAFVDYNVFKLEESVTISFWPNDSQPNSVLHKVKTYPRSIANLISLAGTNSDEDVTRSLDDIVIPTDDLLLVASISGEEFAICCSEMGEILKVDRYGNVIFSYSPQNSQFMFTGACFNHLNHLILATQIKSDNSQSQNYLFHIEMLNENGQLINHFEPKQSCLINDYQIGSLIFLSVNKQGNLILMGERGHGCTFKLPQQATHCQLLNVVT